MSDNSTESDGVRAGFLLFLLFLGLKLGKVITWSWWWVTAPLWAPVAIFVVFVLIAILVAAIVGDD